ncbi:tetratricopeptide repeat protein [Fimbriiglobus ruber]|uniref:Putative tetratricopeptide repeat family protein n=1 Tax=Fimbriiglobus ruber TaxID=1908690 RepID=A0A225DUI2_9BACT|nr:tetratricopeptide repeat protein [Fimbriiglobus ruber]OWK45062.1 putative tetratricopeptide repeat family protein [Fimbriiglobus ruber]
MTITDLLHWASVGHLTSGRPTAARETGQDGLRTDPDHPGLNEVVGLAEHDLEEYARAIHYLETAARHGLLGVTGELTLADCYLRFGLVRAAAAVYDRLANPGQCPTPHLPALAKGLGRVGRYAAAQNVCDRLARLRPDYHPAWYGAAVYRLMLGRPLADVLPALERAHRLAPHALPYRLTLAAALTDVGRAADAYPLVRNLSAEDVACGGLCRRLLAVFAHAGDAAQLDAYQARADRLAPQSPSRAAGHGNRLADPRRLPRPAGHGNRPAHE